MEAALWTLQSQELAAADLKAKIKGWQRRQEMDKQKKWALMKRTWAGKLVLTEGFLQLHEEILRHRSSSGNAA